MKNMFCSVDDLKNEASVEVLFVNRLLEYLGYSDGDISYKESISEIAVGKGSKKILYKPDYVVKTNQVPTIVIDAKSPDVDIMNWTSQCSSYCLELNKEFDYNPIDFYLLSNGLKSALFKWDQKKPVLELDFEDFSPDSLLLKELCEKISREASKKIADLLKEKLEEEEFLFETITLDDLKSRFQRVHQEIWQSEKKGPAAAFNELIKIFFVKIRKDKELHLKYGSNPKPKYKDVTFSVNWIASQTETTNPINDLLFKNLVVDLEKDIISGKKKRFFVKGDQINLSAETLKKVVKEIESVDLYGMEEDIHGRMFEAFLDATIRGKDIGQFFTPRDIVDLMVEIGSPEVSAKSVDKVLDACCGSGGFLISALSTMLKQLSDMKGLSANQRSEMEDIIKTQSVCKRLANPTLQA